MSKAFDKVFIRHLISKLISISFPQHFLFYLLFSMEYVFLNGVIFIPFFECTAWAVYRSYFIFHVPIHTSNFLLIRANKVLGFIKRQCVELNKLRATILLYNSYARALWEYYTTIWSPAYKIRINRLENCKRYS